MASMNKATTSTLATTISREDPLSTKADLVEILGKEDIAELKGKCSSLETKYSSLEENNAELKEKYTELKEKYAHLEALIYSMQTQIQEVKGANATLESPVKSLQADNNVKSMSI